MTSNLLYAIGTLLSWAGWLFAVRTVILLAQLLTHSVGPDKHRVQRGLMFLGGGAFALLIAGAAAVPPVPPDGTAGPMELRFPLVWFVMPYSAWLAAAAFAMAAGRGLQAGLALNPDDTLGRARSAAGWLAAAVAFVFLYRSDPGNKIEILRGGIEFRPAIAVGLMALAIATIFAMVIASRATTTRGYAKAIANQIALVVGSILFGLPFVFLVITSFKEDRDMSSPNGIVWIPRVQETVPYFNPKDPLVEGPYKGEIAQGNILERHADGTVRVDIQRPLSIRGATFDIEESKLKIVPRRIPVVEGTFDGEHFTGKVVEEKEDGNRQVAFLTPASLAGKEKAFAPADLQPVRHIGLKWDNYPEALSYLPPETNKGLVYLKNTLILVIFSVIGTILSSSIVAYAFSRMQFPGRDGLFGVLLSTMMLPAAVTLLPQFLIFRSLGWIDTLYPIWVPAFFGSAFNIFLLRQFFMQIPMELEDASKIDGCGYLKTFWAIMLPQIKPALAVIAIWTFVGAWNNFMGPLIYVNSPENMPLSYALQLFKGDRNGEPGLLMAFATLCMLPVLALFFFAQRYFIEGVTLSGLGGR